MPFDELIDGSGVESAALGSGSGPTRVAYDGSGSAPGTSFDVGSAALGSGSGPTRVAYDGD